MDMEILEKEFSEMEMMKVSANSATLMESKNALFFTDP